MQSSITKEVYRYSTRSIIGASIAWVIMFSGLSFFLVVSILQIARTGKDFGLLILIGVPLMFWIAAPIAWLRGRPTLAISADGIRVSQFGGRPYFVGWQEIQRIEDIRRVNVQTGKRLRFFCIVWRGGKIPFNQFYNNLPQLLAVLNEKIDAYGIEVLMRNYEPDAIRRMTGTDSKIRKTGVVSSLRCLEVA
jgi:hypothetical protein